MTEDQYKTKDLILASYLKMEGENPNITRDEEKMGVFSFSSTAKDKAVGFYNNQGRFKEFHNTIRDLKQQVKAI